MSTMLIDEIEKTVTYRTSNLGILQCLSNEVSTFAGNMSILETS